MSRFSAIRATMLPLALVVCCHLSATPAKAHGPSTEMAQASKAFLASLDDAQREKATFDFGDEERGDWHFVPRDRKGLPLTEITDEQRQLAVALMKSALSEQGLTKALNIWTLEQVLEDLEGENPSHLHDLYFFSVFGDSSGEEAWGWRVEGHHLSLNFTVVGHDVAWTPSFFGSNPSEVLAGPHKGLRVLGREEDLARELVRSLTPDQQRTAVIDTDSPSDIFNMPGRKAQAVEPAGLAAGDMNEVQGKVLRELVEEYVRRLRPELAEIDLAEIDEAGFANLQFAWIGGLDPGQRHYYRVQGPTFILEYDNSNDSPNHAHSVWRSYENDFGEDLLRRHYEESHNE